MQDLMWGALIFWPKITVFELHDPLWDRRKAQGYVKVSCTLSNVQTLVLFRVGWCAERPNNDHIQREVALCSDPWHQKKKKGKNPKNM